MSEKFDFDKALTALRNGQDLTGKDGILTLLIKQLVEASLKAELEAHLAGDETPNCKNGSTKKTIKSTSGSFEMTVRGQVLPFAFPVLGLQHDPPTST